MPNSNWLQRNGRLIEMILGIQETKIRANKKISLTKPKKLEVISSLFLTLSLSLPSSLGVSVWQISYFFFICSEFCHTLKWNSHGFTCVPHPYPPSHLPLHPLPLGLPSAPGPSTCLMHTTCNPSILISPNPFEALWSFPWSSYIRVPETSPHPNPFSSTICVGLEIIVQV